MVPRRISITNETYCEKTAERNSDILSSAERVDLLGLKIHNFSMAEALLAIVEIVERRRFAYAVTPNVDHTVKLRKSAQFREVYQKAELVVADGVPLVWASRMLGTPLKERINGTDLFERTCELAAGLCDGHVTKVLGPSKERSPMLATLDRLMSVLGLGAVILLL